MSLEFTQVLNILVDPFKLIEILGGVFAIIGGLYAAGAILLPWWRTWRDRRSLRKRLGAELYTPVIGGAGANGNALILPSFLWAFPMRMITSEKLLIPKTRFCFLMHLMKIRAPSKIIANG